MKSKLLLYAFLILSIISCSDDDPPSISPGAKNYLDEVLDLMQRNSINKKTIDWSDFKSKVYATVTGAQSIADTYPGIAEALRLLGDNHSIFTKPNGDVIYIRVIQCNAQAIVKPTIPKHIGYVKVNSFAGPSSDDAAIAFARGIQNQIKSQDNADIKGWIVDLRSNLGGNMWPMLAGIGPILGEVVVGYFIDPDGNQESWSYLDGASKITDAIVTQLNDPYEVIVANPKVAVLLDNGVASSGEVIAICFIGRENTKSFGSPTCGLSTANQSFPLSDGSSLNLTVAHLADRNKNTFGNAILPDQASTNATIIQDAITWIED
jgi:C-terminal processing protease CtpA/Prc